MNCPAIRFCTFTLVAVVQQLVAQKTAAEEVHKLLPTGAQIVEMADLTAAAGKSRTLVLWMENTKRIGRGYFRTTAKYTKIQ
jgi:hypothetical protein